MAARSTDGKTIDRVLLSEEDRLNEIEKALMEEFGKKQLTADIKRMARAILNKWKENEPPLSKALEARWREKGEGIILRYPGQPIAERKEELRKEYLSNLSEEELKKVRESIKHPNDITYHVEDDLNKNMDGLRAGWEKSERRQMRSDPVFWGTDDEP